MLHRAALELDFLVLYTTMSIYQCLAPAETAIMQLRFSSPPLPYHMAEGSYHCAQALKGIPAPFTGIKAWSD